MANGLTAIQIGNDVFPIDFSQHDHDDRYTTQNVIYSQLKSYRDNGKLIPGKKYRIIDYVTKVSGNDNYGNPVLSAEHPFNIVVEAITENTLCDDAYAVRTSNNGGNSDGGYFENEYLSGWKLRYCLDNDTTKFRFADPNGKGVIYRMTDEYNNSLPYDFKNVIWTKDVSNNPIVRGEFYRSGSWFSCTLKRNVDCDFINENTLIEFECWEINSFNGPNPSFSCFFVIKDEELTETSQVFYYDNDSNFIDASGIFRLTQIVTTIKYFTFGNIESIDYTGLTYDYTIKRYGGSARCTNNVFDDACYGNSFGNDCSGNSFGNDCSGNSFGNACNNNSIGNYCYRNSFGNGCSDNSFGNYCSDNSFGNDCSDNSFGNYCSDNSFGNYCSDNSFGNFFYSNSFGNYCYYNSFGNGCNNNYFVVDEFRNLLLGGYGYGSGSGEEIGAFEEISEVNETGEIIEDNTNETGA